MRRKNILCHQTHRGRAQPVSLQRLLRVPHAHTLVLCQQDMPLVHPVLRQDNVTFVGEGEWNWGVLDL